MDLNVVPDANARQSEPKRQASFPLQFAVAGDV